MLTDDFDERRPAPRGSAGGNLAISLVLGLSGSIGVAVAVCGGVLLDSMPLGIAGLGVALLSFVIFAVGRNLN